MPIERSTTRGLGWPALLALALSAHGLVAPRPLASQVPETETQSGREEGGDDGLEVGDVVVTGTRTETPLADSPARLDVITRADIDRSGARDVGELLEEQIGVVVTRSFRGDSIQLGGLDPEYTLILVDGDRAPGRIGGGIDLGRFTIENVERIEILRGPGSALYGSDAIGGVVNSLTRRGTRPLELEASVQGGLSESGSGVAGMLDVGAMGAMREGPLSLRATGGYHVSEAFRRGDAFTTSGSARDQWELGARGSLEIDDVTIDARADHVVRRLAGVDENATGAVFDRGIPPWTRTQNPVMTMIRNLVLDGNMKNALGFAGLSVASVVAAGCGPSTPAAPSTAEVAPVLETYADILHASYEDSLVRGRALDTAVEAFVASPSDALLEDARDAWVASRPPYLQSEIGRYYGGPIDDPDNDIDGRVNSWPLDEAYLDYVQGPPPAFEDLVGGLVNEPASLPVIDEASLAALNGEGAEENVSLGYHAIEFLLWGQDLYEDSAGRRPATDFVDGMRDNADRRRDYVVAATDILVGDLEFLEGQWRSGGDNYRAGFVALDAHEGLTRVFTAILNLSGLELAGERLLVAWRSSEQEDEHSCFSDTTTQDAVYDQLGLQNAYLGRYERIDGTLVSGASLSDLVRARDPELDASIRTALEASLEATRAIPAPFDQALISTEGRTAIRRAIDAIQAQTELLGEAARLLGLDITLGG